MTPVRVGMMRVALALVVVVAAGCGAGGPTPTLPPALASTNVGPTGSAGFADATSAAESQAPGLTSPVVGVVIAVDSAGLDKVSGFTVRLKDGALQAFRIGILENGVEFPPGHLKEHAVSAAPVRVFFRPEGADLVVYRIEDAG